MKFSEQMYDPNLDEIDFKYWGFEKLDWEDLENGNGN